MSIFISILDGINSVLGNYGWSVMVFTLLVRIILFPFDYKSRVSMRKTTKLQPQIAKLQKKYANDKDKLNLKMSELYKKEKINPLSSCLPLLLSYPILIMMFNAMRTVANDHLLAQVLEILQNPAQMPAMEGWLWVKNMWMPDSPFSPARPDMNMLRQITDSNLWLSSFEKQPEVWANIIAQYPDLVGITAESFSGSNLQGTIQLVMNALASTEIYQLNAGTMPGWNFNLIITTLSLMKDWNGLFLLPLLSAGSQFLMTKLTPTQPAADPQQQQQQSSMSFMTWFFPLFSLWICSSYNGVFALYWVTSNLIAMVQTVAINKYLDNKDTKAEALSGEGEVK